jgi:hypothetical protein
MWSKCYNTFTFDLQKVSDAIMDNGEKQFQINFQVDGISTLTYNFLLIVSYQMETYIDQITGSCVSDK